MAVFRRNLSFSSRSFCAAVGTVDVPADKSAVSVERERAMVSFACIVLSIGTFTMLDRARSYVISVIRMCIVLNERQQAVLKVHFWCSQLVKT